jgi:hypothetical protein
MSAKTMKDVGSKAMLRELMLIAEEEFMNRRSERRFPFFRPISVEADNHSYSAFTREICASGIGLLHNVELPLEEVSVTLKGRPQKLRILIERCESIGEGWYISGGKFVNTVA